MNITTVVHHIHPPLMFPDDSSTLLSETCVVVVDPSSMFWADACFVGVNDPSNTPVGCVFSSLWVVVNARDKTALAASVKPAACASATCVAGAEAEDGVSDLVAACANCRPMHQSSRQNTNRGHCGIMTSRIT